MSGVLVLAAGVVAAAGSLGPSGKTALANAPAPAAGIGVDGTYVNRVKLNGSVISLDQYAEIERRSSTTSTPLHLVVEPAAVARGYFLAFGSPARLTAYLDSISPGRRTTADQADTRSVRSRAVTSPVRLAGDHVDLTTCSLPNHQGFFYDSVSCTSTSFSILWGEIVNDMGTYGWDNRASSIALGDCIANLTVWENNNRSGASRTFHGASVYTSINYGGSQNWDNRISSYQTDTTGPCL